MPASTIVNEISSEHVVVNITNGRPLIRRLGKVNVGGGAHPERAPADAKPVHHNKSICCSPFLLISLDLEFLLRSKRLPVETTLAFFVIQLCTLQHTFSVSKMAAEALVVKYIIVWRQH